MLIKIISVLNPTVAMGHYKRSVLLTKILRKNHNVELTVLEKNPYSKLLNQYKKNLIKKNFDFIIFDISNRKIYTKSLLKLIDKIILEYKYKVIITDSLGEDAIHYYLKNNKFILHLPYFLSKYDLKGLNKKFRFKMLGLKYSVVNKVKKVNYSLKHNSKILITFGASDKFSKSYNILKSVIKTCDDQILFIVGPFFKTELVNKIKKLQKKSNNIRIVKFGNSLIKHLSNSDMIITNSGISKYESIFTKKPVMVVYENKKIFKMNKNFIKEKVSYNFFYNKKKLDKECQIFIKKKFNFALHIKNRKKIVSNNNNNFEKYLSRIYEKGKTLYNC